MKRFHELTEEQQKQAVKYARRGLDNLFLHGVIVSNDKAATPEYLWEVAECAARESWYSESTDMIVAGIADGK